MQLRWPISAILDFHSRFQFPILDCIFNSRFQFSILDCIFDSRLSRRGHTLGVVFEPKPTLIMRKSSVQRSETSSETVMPSMPPREVVHLIQR